MVLINIPSALFLSPSLPLSLSHSLLSSEEAKLTVLAPDHAFHGMCQNHSLKSTEGPHRGTQRHALTRTLTNIEESDGEMGTCFPYLLWQKQKSIYLCLSHCLISGGYHINVNITEQYILHQNVSFIIIQTRGLQHFFRPRTSIDLIQGSALFDF